MPTAGGGAAVTGDETEVGLGGRPAEVAIVTGAASGIGRAVASRLSAQGHPVAVWDVDAAAGLQFAAELESAGRSAEFMAVDVSDRGRVAECVAQVCNRLGPQQILVNCAGINSSAPISELEPEDWYRVMRVILTACFSASRR